MICANRKRLKRIEFIRINRKRLREKKKEIESYNKTCQGIINDLSHAVSQEHWDTIWRTSKIWILWPARVEFFLKNFADKVDALHAEKLKEWRKRYPKPWWECV